MGKFESNLELFRQRRQIDCHRAYLRTDLHTKLSYGTQKEQSLYRTSSQKPFDDMAGSAPGAFTLGEAKFNRLIECSFPDETSCRTLDWALLDKYPHLPRSRSNASTVHIYR